MKWANFATRAARGGGESPADLRHYTAGDPDGTRTTGPQAAHQLDIPQ